MARRRGRTYALRMIRTSAIVATLGALVTLAPVGRGHADALVGRAGLVDDERQVALAADIGLSGGGVTTPGGLRFGGHYLYRLADHDWFDSGLAFTFGGHGDACGLPLARAPVDGAPLSCARDVTDGFAADLALGVRRELRPRRGFTPFVRLAGFARVLRFEDTAGVAAGGELGAGVRAPITPQLAVVAAANGFLGVAHLDGPTADRRQLGLTVTVGAEIAMR